MVGYIILFISLIILRFYDGHTSILNSAILHHKTDFKCPEMSNCPYTGRTLMEKRELPLLQDQAVSKTEEQGGATVSEGCQSDQPWGHILRRLLIVLIVLSVFIRTVASLVNVQ